MKRALSLILAVVMVALMIPFAAVTSFAETTATEATVLSETDFTKWAADGNANAVTAKGETVKLPDGWVAPAQESTDRYSSVDAEYGVILGGANMGIGTTVNPVEGKSTYVIEVTWNTPHKFCILRFGFADAAFTADKIWAENQIAFYYTGGISNQKAFTEGDKDGLATMLAASNCAASIADGSVGAAGKNLVMSTEVKDANGNVVNVDASRLGLLGQAATGKDFKTFIEVVDGKVAYVHMQSEGARYTYTPAVEVTAGGYFSIWHTNWGTNNSMNVKSVKFVDGAYVPEELPVKNTNVVHAYDVASAKTLEDIPYDINEYNDEASGYTATTWLENGTLWQKVSHAGKTIHNKTNIKIDGSLLPANNTYTLEAVIAAGSTSDILWFDFGMTDDETANYGFVDGNAFKLRLTNTYSNVDKMSSDNGQAQFGTTYAANSAFPSSMVENYQNGSDITVRVVVYEGYVVGGYVTIEGETVMVVHANGIHSAPAGDIGIVQRHQADTDAQVGIKSIKIWDDAMFGGTPVDVDPLALNLPNGWVATQDDLVDQENRADANGVTLASSQQHMQLTEKVGVGQKRVVAIDWGTYTKLSVIRVSWEANVGDAQSYSWDQKSDLDFCVLGGPDADITDAAFMSVKVSDATRYNWKSNNEYQTSTVTTMVEGAPVTTSSEIRRWGAISTDAYKAARDGANKGTGTTMVIYIDIDENNKITAFHRQFRYYDADGNFVSETVLSVPVTVDNTVVCDGYLTIGHNGMGTNTTLTVKSVNIYAGSYAEMGEALHSTDFKTFGALNPQKVATEYISDALKAGYLPELTAGEASLREDPNGIRFTTSFNATDLQTVVDFYDAGYIAKAEFGTLITTTPWATAAGAVTHKALDAVAGEKTAYIEVMATIGEWYAENTFAGTVSTTNTEREYQAVGFLKFTLVDGTVVYAYADVNTATIASVTPTVEA